MKAGWIFGMLLLLTAGAVATEPAGEEAVAEDTGSGRLSIEEAGRLLATGRAAYEDGLLRLASRRLEEVLSGAPDSRRRAEAALWLARVRLAESRPAAAIEVLDAHAEPVRATALLSDILLTRAQALLQLRQFADAASVLQGYAQRFPGHDNVPTALRLLTKAYAAQEDWPEARAVCQELESQHAGHPDARAACLELAAALGEAGRVQEARTVLQRIETAYDGQLWSERAALQNAELLLAHGERPQALDRLQALVGNTNLQAATRAQGYQIVAQALGAETNYQAALSMIERGIAIASDPAQRLESQMVQSRLLIQSGQLSEGAALLRSVVVQIPDPARAGQLHLELADALATLELWSEAAAEYQAWLDAFEGATGTPEALTGLAWALWGAERFAEAARAFERAAAATEGAEARQDLLHKMADAHFASGQHSQAKAAYQRVLEPASPDSDRGQRIRFQLAETELALGETEAGEIRLLDLSRSRRETATTRAAIQRLGALYEQRGALETAVEQYGRLIDACTDALACAEALLARGMIRYRTGAFQSALDDFVRIRKELSQTPPAAQAYFMHGWCLYLLGKNAEALEVCEQFLVDYPQSDFVPDVLFWLAEQAFNHADYETAERRFLSVATDHPGSPRAADALFWAGRAATARRAYLPANEHYNALMTRYPDSSRLAEALLAQGDVLSELGQFAAAILAFDEVILRFPQSPEALMAWGRKGDCQYTLGQDNPARYEEALLSYRMLHENAAAPVDLRLQAGYKIGRCLEKMGRVPAALDRYMEVAYAFLQEAGPPPEATVWFTRAAFGAAALQERAGNWREAAGIYRRVADSGVPAAVEARDRMDRIRRDHWLLF